jgi:hypothetical protein
MNLGGISKKVLQIVTLTNLAVVGLGGRTKEIEAGVAVGLDLP